MQIVLSHQSEKHLAAIALFQQQRHYFTFVLTVPRSACHSSPCLHGGTCLDSSNTADVAFNANGYKCLCFEGFVGMNCEG